MMAWFYPPVYPPWKSLLKWCISLRPLCYRCACPAIRLQHKDRADSSIRLMHSYQRLSRCWVQPDQVISILHNNALVLHIYVATPHCTKRFSTGYKTHQNYILYCTHDTMTNYCHFCIYTRGLSLMLWTFGHVAVIYKCHCCGYLALI